MKLILLYMSQTYLRKMNNIDPNTIATQITDKIGGIKNLKSVTHCVTRLRIVPVDKSLIDVENLHKIEGVIEVVIAGGQIQFVIGTKVSLVYDIFTNQYTHNDGALKEEIKFIEYIYLIFKPIIPLICISLFMKFILVVSIQLGFLTYSGSTATILYAICDTVLYFLPFFLAMSSARTFNVNEYISMALVGTLLYPTLVSAFNTATSIEFFSINILLPKFSQTVIPIIIAIFLLAKLDIILRNKVSSLIASFIVPLLDLLILVPLMIIVIGPLYAKILSLFHVKEILYLHDDIIILALVFIYYIIHIYICDGRIGNKKLKKVIIYSPISGSVSQLSKCEHPMFASGIYGNGIEIKTANSKKIYSPISGKITYNSNVNNYFKIENSEIIIKMYIMHNHNNVTDFNLEHQIKQNIKVKKNQEIAEVSENNFSIYMIFDNSNDLLLGNFESFQVKSRKKLV